MIKRKYLHSFLHMQFSMNIMLACLNEMLKEKIIRSWDAKKIALPKCNIKIKYLIIELKTGY